MMESPPLFNIMPLISNTLNPLAPMVPSNVSIFCMLSLIVQLVSNTSVVPLLYSSIHSVVLSETNSLMTMATGAAVTFNPAEVPLIVGVPTTIEVMLITSAFVENTVKFHVPPTRACSATSSEVGSHSYKALDVFVVRLTLLVYDVL